ncbi:MAG: DUF2723 domain-containing protein [Melioribacteraceae bacterium]|nr:MAG: DUF2723 domain-containing protein [Melioribacteraceae bacterium]
MKIFSKFYAEITALVVFIIYTFTLAPTIIHLDAGELTAVQATLGIAHPTGYPLFTILGYFVSKLFLFVDTVLVLNLLVSIYCAGSVYILAKLTFLLLSNFSEKVKIGKKFQQHLIDIPIDSKGVIASVVGLMVGFSKTFWFQSTSVEVYSLHLLLISLILFFAVRAYYNIGKYDWYFVAIFLAFAFSNHMTTLLLLPGIALLFFNQNGLKKESFLKITKMIAIFVPLLVVIYSYLPIRALQEPILNWGNPIDFERIIRHITGKQYQVWIFSSTEAAKKQFEYFVNSLPIELGYIGLIISMIGIPILLKYTKILGIFFLINFFSTLFYSINYDIADIDAYFLLAFISLIIFSSALFIKFIQRLSKKFIYLFFAIPLVMVVINFNNVDQSNKYAFEDYTKSILENSTENSIVMSYLWDYFISPSYYYQFVENYRDDVVIVDKELLRRSWYFSQLSNLYPEVMANVSTQSISFLKALEPFEKDEAYDSRLLEERFRNLLTSFISNNIEERDFYITPELFLNEIKSGELTLPKGYELVPMEYTFKVAKVGADYIPINYKQSVIRFDNNLNHYEITIRNLIVNVMIYRLLYEIQFGMFENAKVIHNKIKHDFPEYNIPPAVLRELEKIR